jgi:hypothetical protein
MSPNLSHSGMLDQGDEGVFEDGFGQGRGGYAGAEAGGGAGGDQAAVADVAQAIQLRP